MRRASGLLRRAGKFWPGHTSGGAACARCGKNRKRSCGLKYQCSAVDQDGEDQLERRRHTMGGSIIMPIDISIEGATRVMMRNGKNNGNPISKVRLSSEIMNAGITMRIDKSSGFRGVFSPDLSTNKRKSSSWTFFRNPRK